VIDLDPLGIVGVYQKTVTVKTTYEPEPEPDDDDDDDDRPSRPPVVIVTPEDIEELPPEEAAVIIEEMEISDAVDILEQVEPTVAADIIEEISEETAVEILVEVDVAIAAEILETVNETTVGDILDVAVQVGETETVTLILLEMDENTTAGALLSADPGSGAAFIESMAELNLTETAMIVEAAIKLRARELDPDDAEELLARTADMLEEVTVQSLVDLFIEIAGLPDTPSSVADVFEVMDWQSVGCYRSLGFNGCASRTGRRLRVPHQANTGEYLHRIDRSRPSHYPRLLVR